MIKQCFIFILCSLSLSCMIVIATVSLALHEDTVLALGLAHTLTESHDLPTHIINKRLGTMQGDP